MVEFKKPNTRYHIAIPDGMPEMVVHIVGVNLYIGVRANPTPIWYAFVQQISTVKNRLS